MKKWLNIGTIIHYNPILRYKYSREKEILLKRKRKQRFVIKTYFEIESRFKRSKYFLPSIFISMGANIVNV